MDLKTLAEFVTLLVSGNPVTSQAQGCQTKMMGLAKGCLQVMSTKKQNEKYETAERFKGELQDEFRRKGAQKKPPAVQEDFTRSVFPTA